MPKIPGESNMYSLDVPVAAPDTRTAGVEYEALSKLGDQITTVSAAIGQDLMQEEAKVAVNRQKIEDELAHAEYYNQLKLSAPDGYIQQTNPDGTVTRAKNPDGSDRTMSQEYRDWANGLYQRNQMRMPNQMAKEAYAAEGMKYFGERTVLAHHDQQEQQSAALMASEQQDLLKYDQQLSSTPELWSKYSRVPVGPVKDFTQTAINPTKALGMYDFYDQLSSTVNSRSGKMYGSLRGQANLTEYGQKLSETYVSNRMNHIMSAFLMKKPTRAAEVGDLIAALNGTDAQTEARHSMGQKALTDLLNPAKKDEWIKTLIHLRDQASHLDLKDFRLEVKAAQGIVRKNGDLGNGPDGWPKMYGLVKMYHDAGKLSPQETSEFAVGFGTAQMDHFLDKRGFEFRTQAEQKAILESAVKYGMGVESKWTAIIGEVPGFSFKSKMQTELEAHGRAEMEKRNERFNNDPAKAVADNYMVGNMGSGPQVQMLEKVRFDDIQSMSGNKTSLRILDSFINRVGAEVERKTGDKNPNVLPKDYSKKFADGVTKLIKDSQLNNNANSDILTDGLLKLEYGMTPGNMRKMMYSAIAHGDLTADYRMIPNIIDRNAPYVENFKRVKSYTSLLIREKLINDKAEEAVKAKQLDMNTEIGTLKETVSPFLNVITQSNPFSAKTAADAASLEKMIKLAYLDARVNLRASESEAAAMAKNMIGSGVRAFKIDGRRWLDGTQAHLVIPTTVSPDAVGRATETALSSIENIRQLNVAGPIGMDGKESKWTDKMLQGDATKTFFVTSENKKGVNLWYWNTEDASKYKTPYQLKAKDAKGNMTKDAWFMSWDDFARMGQKQITADQEKKAEWKRKFIEIGKDLNTVRPAVVERYKP